ncbi:MAG: hypothetical protein ACLUE2_00235 [Bacteroides cellulosilyticus]
MKHASLLLLLTFLFGLTACSKPADPTLMNYEQSLARADSLVQSGAADSARIARLLSGLHSEYNQVKEHSGGSLVRIKPADKRKQYLWGAFTRTDDRPQCMAFHQRYPVFQRIASTAAIS